MHCIVMSQFGPKGFLLGEVFLPSHAMVKRPWGEMGVKEEMSDALQGGIEGIADGVEADGEIGDDGYGYGGDAAEPDGFGADTDWDGKWDWHDGDDDDKSRGFGVHDCTWAEQDEHPSSWEAQDGGGWRGWSHGRGQWQPKRQCGSSSGSSSSGRYVKGGWVDANEKFWPMLGML